MSKTVGWFISSNETIPFLKQNVLIVLARKRLFYIENPHISHRKRPIENTQFRTKVHLNMKNDIFSWSAKLFVISLSPFYVIFKQKSLENSKSYFSSSKTIIYLRKTRKQFIIMPVWNFQSLKNFIILISKNVEKHHTDLNRNFRLKSYGFLTRNLNNHFAKCKVSNVQSHFRYYPIIHYFKITTCSSKIGRCLNKNFGLEHRIFWHELRIAQNNQKP